MKEELKNLLDLKIITHLTEPEKLSPGTIIRRVNRTKDQQGQFTGFDDADGFIILNVLDMSNSDFITEAGIIRPSKGDELYKYNSTFLKNRKSADALEVLTTWTLYKKNPDLQPAMQAFLQSVFSPEHILYLKQKDRLDNVLIPMQKKLKIGRYTEVTDWDKIGKEKFHMHLKELKPGEHITYIALIPQTSSYSPKFYSIGTKPHEETLMLLRTEPFNFKPTHGGHIKADKSDNGIIYYVDAGSNFIGKGLKAKIQTAENIANALKREYKNYVFKALEGRGAFGTEQSY